jgi:hypothetical protein
MVSWTVVFVKQAQKDAKKLAAAGLRPEAEVLLALLAEDPFRTPLPWKSGMSAHAALKNARPPRSKGHELALCRGAGARARRRSG